MMLLFDLQLFFCHAA